MRKLFILVILVTIVLVLTGGVIYFQSFFMRQIADNSLIIWDFSISIIIVIIVITIIKLKKRRRKKKKEHKKKKKEVFSDAHDTYRTEYY